MKSVKKFETNTNLNESGYISSVLFMLLKMVDAYLCKSKYNKSSVLQTEGEGPGSTSTSPALYKIQEYSTPKATKKMENATARRVYKIQGVH